MRIFKLDDAVEPTLKIRNRPFTCTCTCTLKTPFKFCFLGKKLCCQQIGWEKNAVSDMGRKKIFWEHFMHERTCFRRKNIMSRQNFDSEKTPSPPPPLS